MDDNGAKKQRRFFNRKKATKYFIIAVCIVTVVGTALFVTKTWRANRGRTVLIETTYKEDNSLGAKTEPTAEEYQAMLPQVLNVAPANRDSSLESGALVRYQSELSEEYEVLSTAEIVNYLGEYQVNVVVTGNNVAKMLNSPEQLQEFNSRIISKYSELFITAKDIRRIFYEYRVQQVPFLKFYVERNSPDVLIYDKVYPRDTTLSEVAKEDKYSTAIANIQKEYLTTTYQYTLYKSDTEYTLDMALDFGSPSVNVDDALDIMDTVFLLANQQNLPTRVTIKAVDSLLFAGYIKPQASSFTNFYTNRPYYQDISRIQYYYCNNWLHGELYTIVAEYLKTLTT